MKNRKIRVRLFRDFTLKCLLFIRNDRTRISQFFIILNRFRNIGNGDRLYRHPTSIIAYKNKNI